LAKLILFGFFLLAFLLFNPLLLFLFFLTLPLFGLLPLSLFLGLLESLLGSLVLEDLESTL